MGFRRNNGKTTIYFGSSGFGQKGGLGPNAGKTATKYRVILPDTRSFIVRSFYQPAPDRCIATGFDKHDGSPCVCVWPDGRVPWEGDYGRLEAVKIS